MEEIIINPDFKKPVEEKQKEQVKKHVVYKHAIFHRRVLANLIDFILFVIAFISTFLAIRGIVSATPTYIEINNNVEEIQRESGLYRTMYSTGRTMDVVAYWRLQDDATSSKAFQLEVAIDQFLNYCDEKCEPDTAKKIRKSYDDYKENCIYEYEIDGVKKSENLFVYKEGVGYIENTNVNKDYVTRKVFFDHGYAPFIENFALGYLIQDVPGYYDGTRYLSNILLVEIIPSFPFAALLIYMIPPLIFRRGGKTIGKLIYRIGLVSEKDCYSPSIGKIIARQSIVVFAEFCLSVVTVCVPFLISFSMMAFTKKRQGFPDFMLGLREVDTTDNRIYFNEEEIIKELVGKNDTVVDFKVPKSDF